MLQVTAAGLTLPAVMLARGMVGLGEGVALPSMNNLVANNVPLARRSTALGGCFTGFHTGPASILFSLQCPQRCTQSHFIGTHTGPASVLFLLRCPQQCTQSHFTSIHTGLASIPC